ncbi:MAG: glycosyltransferase family A protein [Lachnospiraceae bacterium]|nr:glycosyltransferase family A protein [Lachnospiraceae bacterium]
MNLEVLVSAMHQKPDVLIEKMQLESDTIIINQCDQVAYEEICKDGPYGKFKVRFFSFAERGVGLSRNNALLRAQGDILLFSDDDIVYDPGYSKLVIQEFEKHPEADMLLFNFDVIEERKTYDTTEFKRVRTYNCGRYPTFSFAVRREKLHRFNITYSLLFGGGARYSNGEDSLFIRECIRKRMRVYATPVRLGTEEGTPSTWFHGYNEKFFYDRGVLYQELYGRAAKLLAIRFLLKHKNKMCQEISASKAYKLMKNGIEDMRQ